MVGCEDNDSMKKLTRASRPSFPPLLVLCLVAVSGFSFHGASAFSPSQCNILLAKGGNNFLTTTTTTTTENDINENRRCRKRYDCTWEESSTRRSQLGAIAAGVQAAPQEMSDFQRRMRNAIAPERRRQKNSSVEKKKQQQSKTTTSNHHSNVHVVHTLDEYKRLVGDEKEKIVVVRFYAPWCKACRAIAPSFYKLANTFGDAKFVEVPVTNKNANLHQGLDVHTLPFGHIYYPKSGLVEEMRLTRKHFPRFARTVMSYVMGYCDLVDGDSTSPFLEETP